MSQIPVPSKFPVWAATGRQATWGFVAWQSYREWTDGDAGLDDLYMAGVFAITTVAVVVPDPVATLTGFIIRQGIVPSITRTGASVGRFIVGVGSAYARLPIFRPGGLGAGFAWAIGLTHIATLPWQIKDLQEKKEREGQVDTMALVPLDPGDNPMPLFNIGGPGHFVW